MEIERKFRVIKLPDNLEKYKKKIIRQGYLCIQPVVRIRQSDDRYVLTYKNRKGLSQDYALQCQEIEVDLTKEAFFHLLNKVDDNIIEKTRYMIPMEDDLIIELDVFQGKLSGLYFAEVEFRTEEEAKNFKKPDWFGDDVSSDKRFRNTYLSKVEDVRELGL